MKTIKLIITASLCIFATLTYAQSTNIKPLKIGDKMPGMVFSPTINYAKATFNTADYNDRLLIIDFWATWCHYCIEAFPKEDSLSVKFGNKLQFILVDDIHDDNAAKVKGFFAKKLSTDKSFKLPSIYLDTVLVKLFPHRLLPHYVWVKEGVIVAITDAEQINAANIEKVLNGKDLNLLEKTL